MKNKIIIYLAVALILINSVNAGQYFVLSINYILGSLTFNSISLKELDKSVAYHDKAGFLIKVISFDDTELKKIYYNMSENKNYLVYLPYDKNSARIEVYNPDNSKIMDIDVSSFADTCGNKVCEAYESYESCKEDCHSGGKDNFCDGVKDGICDPECSSKLDADCQENKQSEIIGNQSVSSNKQNVDVANNNENNAEQNSVPSPYFSWILIGVGVLLIALLAFLFVKKRKEDTIIEALKRYITENIRRGYTLQQIKDALFKEGYSEKEIDKAIKTI